MTSVKFYRSEDGRLVGYEACGHAQNRSLSGNQNDLVCSAVSVLTQTGVNALEAVAGITPEVEIGDGKLRCMLPDNPAGDREKAQTILETVYVGITEIAKVKAYSRFIHVDEISKQ